MNQDQMDIKTPEFVSLQFQLAGLGSRAAAFIYDSVILGVVSILLFIGSIFVMQGMSSFPFFLDENLVPLAIIVIVLFILNWGYFFACEFFSGGRTIGKKIVGIRVIQENGHSITLLSSFIRNLLRIIDALPASNFLGIMMILLHSKHKRLGDVVAGTIVVHERKAKPKRKLSQIEKEIQQRGLFKSNLTVDEWVLKSFTTKDWNLISTYVSRFHNLSLTERNQFTKQIAEILLPKIGKDVGDCTEQDLENNLLVLYLHLKEEWEFEL